ncbi:MAG TPA: glycosyltransferase [Bacillus bacterium]|nr:glycosyltransferase [Bacillus sp. (in: firmicutes)]
MPTLSALMSVYNGEEFIEETITSILEQSFEDFEFIIIDDGSRDRTIDIINSFHDSRIKLFQLPRNMGVGAALNFGLNKINSPFIAKVDADDIYTRNRFSEQLYFLENNQDIAVVDCLLNYFATSDDVENSERFHYLKNIHQLQINKAINPDEINEKLYWFCCVTHSLMMARTNVIKKIGYNPNFRIGEDYQLFYLLNKRGYKFSKIKEVLGQIRVSEKSTTAIEEDIINVFLTIKQEEFNAFLSQSELGFNYMIWGTGGLGINILNHFPKKLNNIVGFIDSNKQKWGTTVGSFPIYSPEIIKKEKYKIIVASTIGKFEITEILKREKYQHLEDYFVIA